MNTKIIICFILVLAFSGCIEQKNMANPDDNITVGIKNTIHDIGDMILTQIPTDSTCTKNVKFDLDGNVAKFPVDATYTIDEEKIIINRSDVVKYVDNYKMNIFGVNKKDYPIVYSPFTVVRVTVRFDEPIDIFGSRISKLSDVYVCNSKGDII